ncbi:peroxiredoxin [Saccharothrix coeruleofusca]|uniref:peroxiredoxin n=1 Tax=Saccharothrix coeruleofusca TaxID=33919 RepID=UPI001AE26392|nr:peroxiredoxin [Saccharothrix coeruleofusca]MBP2334344.1 peroxiredoxin [Saccharothrix coeruleofusca]
MAVGVGGPAPDFTLEDVHRRPVALSSFRGERNVLLVFFPFAFSGTCTGELGRVRDEIAVYDDGNVQVLGVSVDTPYSLKVWSEQQGFPFPLLSDFWPHGEVARAYGAFHERAGVATRGTFLVDTGGVVRFAEVRGPGEPRDQETWKRAVAALRG